MRIMGAAEDPANPIRKLVGTDQLLGLDHFSFAMDPFGLYCVQPWTLLRQQTGNDAHALPAVFDLSVVRSDPAAHLFTRVPTGVIPDHKQRLLAHRGELLATVLKKLGGDGTHRPAVHEPHPRPLPDLPVGFFSTHQHPVSGQSLRVGVAFDRFFLDETHRLPTIGPGMQTWSLKATPPCLILEAQSPLRARKGEPDQPISSPFFLSYSGSGELIHLLALSQRTPNLLSVERIVSPETRSSVMPSSKLTSAACSSVQRVLGLPNSLGEWRKSSLRASTPCSSKAAGVRLGLEEPALRASRLRSLKAWMALRTVWEAQPKERAICGGVSPLEEAKSIWARRRTKASEERNRAFKAWRSSFESVRTKMGGFMSTTISHYTQPMRPGLSIAGRIPGG